MSEQVRDWAPPARAGAAGPVGGSAARAWLASRAAAIALGLWAAAAAGCASSRADRVVVGSKNFTEQDILGEILAQQLERRTDLAVERRFHLGGTFICHRALVSGEIDLYVEYSGTAFTAILGQPPIADPAEVARRVGVAYAERFGLRWEAPLGFDNTFAMIVRAADARRLGLETLSQAARYAPGWKAGFGYEFMEREDGFRGLARTYGLFFAEPPRVMDLGLTYRALAEGQVDLVAGNSTDGQIEALGLYALRDDRGYFPPYQAAPVVRAATLERHPEVGRALAELAGRMDEAAMRRLNYLVDVQHRDIAEVARNWLAAAVP